MKDNSSVSLFRKLNKLFKNGAQLRKKIKSRDTTVAIPDDTVSSGMLLFQKSSIPSYSAVTTSAYNLSERMMRYQDGQEMEQMPEIAAALDILADECVPQDERGRILHVFSENEKIKELLDDLYFNVLNVDFNLRPWIRNLCKYGDQFLYNDVSPKYGVVNVIPIPVNEIEREENYDRNDPFAVRFRWNSLGNRILENWEVSHFRLIGNDMYAPYGASMLEPARRIWRQLILMEDAMLVYRIVRAPERRVFYIDVGNLPADDVENYMEKQKTQLRSQQVMTQAGGSDLRYNPLPIHSESPIPLLDGRTITIAELAKEYESGKENWVYSISDRDHNILPGKVVWCGKNYTAKKLVKVYLDEKSYVIAAPEHPFILRNGDTKRADELSVNDSLMPLYREVSNKKNGFDIEGYETVYDPKKRKFQLTHRIVANTILAEQSIECRKSTDWSVNNNLTVHHLNVNKLDNSPQNLLWMGNVDHIKMHAQQGRERLIRWNKSDKKKQRVSELNKERNSIQHMEWYNGSELHKEHNENRRQAQLKSWNDPESREKRSKAMSWILTDIMFERIVYFLKENPTWSRQKIHAALMQDEIFINELKTKQTFKKDYTGFGDRTWVAHLKEYGYENLGDLRYALHGKYKNHKVSRVEFLDVDGEDVYCMTVEGPNGENDRHNFAVCGLDINTKIAQVDGIIIKNSIEEDYWLPIRSTDSGTKIDTLAGGQNTAAIEDVEYLQKKLIASLKIPRAYLGYEDSLCLPGDELIPLLNGTNVTIEELVKTFDKEKELYVYSCDETGKIVPGKVIDAWQTKEVNQLHKITLDNGAVIKCTENHPFLLRNGEYCRADELIVGQSLMPLYRKLSSLKEGDFQNGYEKVFNNASGKWEFTHRLVNECGLVQDDESRLTEKSYVVHHVNHNKRNNNPTNLIKMGKKAHITYHMVQGDNLLSESSRDNLREVMKTEKYKKTLHDGIQAAWDNDDGSRRAKVAECNRLHKSSPATMEQLIEVAKNSRGTLEFKNSCKQLNYPWASMINRRTNMTPMEWLNQYINPDASIEQIVNYFLEDKIKNRRIDDFKKNPLPLDCPMGWGVAQRVVRNSGFIGTFEEFVQDLLKHRNHKIANIEIETLNFTIPVYDITIEKYHNFAICGKILDPDCINAGDFENCVIISNSSKSTLSQEDIRFSRTVNSIQKTIVSELNKLAVIHLFAHGYTDNDLMNFSLKLTSPSTIAEQQKLELWRTRFDIIDSAPQELLSQQWLSKNILNLTDAEIRENRQEIEEEGGVDEESLGGGGGSLFGGGGASDLGGEEEESSDSELMKGLEDAGGILGGEGETGEEEEELTTGLEHGADDDELLVTSDDHKNKKASKKYIRPVSRATQAANHRLYVRHKKSGRADIGLSNMSQLVDYDPNPFDGNPFAEAKIIYPKTTLAASADIKAMLNRMREHKFGNIGSNNSNGSVLTEGLDVQEQIDNIDVDVSLSELFIVDDKNEE